MMKKDSSTPWRWFLASSPTREDVETIMDWAMQLHEERGGCDVEEKCVVKQLTARRRRVMQNARWNMEQLIQILQEVKRFIQVVLYESHDANAWKKRVEEIMASSLGDAEAMNQSVVLMEQIMEKKLAGWRERSINASPSFPKFHGMEWTIIKSLSNNPSQESKISGRICMQIQSQRNNSRQFPGVTQVHFDVSRDSLDRLIEEFACIKEKLRTVAS